MKTEEVGEESVEAKVDTETGQEEAVQNADTSVERETAGEPNNSQDDADNNDSVEIIDMSEELKDTSNTANVDDVSGDLPANESEDAEDQFVVHVDESDTNLDYDLGDKPEERDAPTPTKDESMDVDAADIIQSGDGTPAQGEKTTSTGSATADQSAKRFVVNFLLNCQGRERDM